MTTTIIFQKNHLPMSNYNYIISLYYILQMTLIIIFLPRNVNLNIFEAMIRFGNWTSSRPVWWKRISFSKNLSWDLPSTRVIKTIGRELTPAIRIRLSFSNNRRITNPRHNILRDFLLGVIFSLFSTYLGHYNNITKNSFRFLLYLPFTRRVDFTIPGNNNIRATIVDRKIFLYIITIFIYL